MKNIVTSFIFCVFTFTLQSQIVSLNPAFPTRTEEVTITYDANQGSKGLLGLSPVYAHMGLITASSSGGWKYVVGNWGTDDARTKMTSIGNNKHTLKIKIKDFFNVPDDDQIFQLAFVFRNLNGTKEGKTATNGDIFIPFNDKPAELVVNLISPTSKTFVAELGSVIPIRLQASLNSRVQLFIGETKIKDESTTEFNHSINVIDKGRKDIRLIVGDGDKAQTFNFSYTTPPDVVKAALPANTKLGYNRTSSGQAILVLAAPLKKYVHLIGDFNDWKIDNAFALNQTPDERYWWTTINVTDKSYVLYQYLIDGSIKVGDPMSELVLDSNNDGFIPSSNFPNLISFPKESTTGIVTMVDLNKTNFDWTDQNYKRPKKERLIIYELLVRDFIASRNYKTLTDTLDYLQKLGINAIELMPINEFEGNQSWGYNPSYHMALDKAYGSPEMFKRFVNEAHKRGIAVVQDVVFNHAFGQSPLVQMYWDVNTGKPAIGNPYANPDAKHPFNVGYDLNHESPYIKEWMDQILQYWVNEYHIDGFRFDLSKGFTQTQSTESNFSNYDASRVAILKRMADKVWANNPNTYVMLEHFANNDEEKVLAEHGMMLWSNLGFNYNEATMGYVDNGKSDVGYSNYKTRGWSKPHNIVYMESHDEERLYYKNTQFGNTNGSYSTKDKNVALQRIGAAANIFLTTPGPKMIWQFGELGFEHSINTCDNGSINTNCRLSEKPIRWDYLNDLSRYQLYTSFAVINKLRNTHEVMHTSNFTMDVRDGFKQIKLDGDTLDAVSISNFEMTSSAREVNFTHSGTWFDIFSGSQVSVGTTNKSSINLSPGEYRLYFDRKIAKPGISTNVIDHDLAALLTLYPNPSQERIYLDVGQSDLRLTSGKVFDIQGRLVSSFENNEREISTNFIKKEIDISSLESGYYFIVIQTNKSPVLKLFIKQ
jgi:1,4-alpha-glucan branching enzyme